MTHAATPHGPRPTPPEPSPQVSHTLTFRLEMPTDSEVLERVRAALGDAGAKVMAVDRIEGHGDRVVREVTLRARDTEHFPELVSAAGSIDGVVVLSTSDRVLDLHAGGKISIQTKVPVRTREDLALVYTPGVARVCTAIHENPELVRRLTIKRNSVAVISDGSAVLGLGDIGPAAAMPVMEGKAMLLKDFADVDAYPICLDERDPDRLVDMIAAMSTGFGGINLEDISAPRCFEVEGKLRQRLDIPVFHDDQHGTAVVVLAALINAVALVGKTVGPDLKVVVQGIGAAGIAVSNLLMAAGVVDLVGVDQNGIVKPRRKEARDPIFRRFGKQTNPRNLEGEKEIALAGADVFVGLSAGNTLTLEHVELMAPDPIIFAMANPTPEIDPGIARKRAAVIATGRSDYPNQINNVLCFPGLFRGLLDCGAREVNDDMKLAAAAAIAAIVPVEERSPDFVIPSPFDRAVVPAVAAAVARSAQETGAAPAGAPIGS
jgi:malate dehydrogenase (oxaloacetate-decarboxylating)